MKEVRGAVERLLQGSAAERPSVSRESGVSNAGTEAEGCPAPHEEASTFADSRPQATGEDLSKPIQDGQRGGLRRRDRKELP